jgi:hypothetical protein
MTDKSDPENAALEGLEDQSWSDVEYKCNECGNTWENSLEYLKTFDRNFDLQDNKEPWIRIQKTVILNYWRTESYPNDFEPIEQECPICNDELETNSREKRDQVFTLPLKIEKDEEPADYHRNLSAVAPVGYEKVDTR